MKWKIVSNDEDVCKVQQCEDGDFNSFAEAVKSVTQESADKFYEFGGLEFPDIDSVCAFIQELRDMEQPKSGL